MREPSLITLSTPQHRRVIHPTASPYASSSAVRRTTGVRRWRFRIVVALVPVLDPLPDIAGQIHDAIWTGTIGEFAHDRRSTVLATIIRSTFWSCITPWKQACVDASSCLFPLSLCRQTLAGPSRVLVCVLPGYAGHRVVRIAEARYGPSRRPTMARSLHKLPVLPVGHGKLVHIKRIDCYMVSRPLIVKPMNLRAVLLHHLINLRVIGAHTENALWD